MAGEVRPRDAEGGEGGGVLADLCETPGSSAAGESPAASSVFSKGQRLEKLESCIEALSLEGCRLSSALNPAQLAYSHLPPPLPVCMFLPLPLSLPLPSLP